MTTPNKDREGNMNEQNKLTYEQLEYTVERLRNRISELTAPPSEGEILLCAAAAHNMEYEGSILERDSFIIEEYKQAAKAAITKWQEMRGI